MIVAGEVGHSRPHHLIARIAEESERGFVRGEDPERVDVEDQERQWAPVEQEPMSRVGFAERLVRTKRDREIALQFLLRACVAGGGRIFDHGPRRPA